MSETINMSKNTVTSVPIAAADVVDPGMNVETVERFLDSAKNDPGVNVNKLTTDLTNKIKNFDKQL